MDTNYYNKYIKYKLKYLSLMKQTGGQFRNIDVNGNTITFEKDKLDQVVILEGVTKISPLNGEDGYYINNTEKDFETNFKKLEKIDGLNLEVFKSSNIIVIKGNNFKILKDITPEHQGMDPNQSLKLVFTNKINAKEQAKIFNDFVINMDSLYGDYPWNKRLKNLKLFDKKFKAIDFVIQHQKLRFRELAFILDNNPDVYVIIEGLNFSKQWNHNLYEDRTYNESDTDFNSISRNIDELLSAFLSKFKKRVSFGDIGNIDKEYYRQYTDPHFIGKANRKLIHVWKATPIKYNLNDDTKFSDTHTTEHNFDKQLDGVFGIITANIVDIMYKVKLLEESNYLKEYYPSLVETFYNKIIYNE